MFKLLIESLPDGTELFFSGPDHGYPGLPCVKIGSEIEFRSGVKVNQKFVDKVSKAGHPFFVRYGA